jgi:hypothetical protein
MLSGKKDRPTFLEIPPASDRSDVLGPPFKIGERPADFTICPDNPFDPQNTGGRLREYEVLQGLPLRGLRPYFALGVPAVVH